MSDTQSQVDSSTEIDYTYEQSTQNNQPLDYSQEMQSFMMEFAKIQKQLILDSMPSANKTKKRAPIVDYTKLNQYLNDPINFKKELINLSRDAENGSLHYKELIDYNAYSPLDRYIISPTDPTKFKTIEKARQEYYKCLKYVNSMRLEYNNPRIRRGLIRDGYFFGILYENESANDFYIKELEPEFCEVASWQEGCYNFAFDFSFFDKSENKDALATYEAIIPNFFVSGYAKYKNDRKNFTWQEVPSEKSICIPLSDTLPSIPYYSSSLFSLNEIEDYKALQKVKTENDNYKLLAFKFDTFNKTEKPDNFTIRPTTVQQFYGMARQGINEKIGMIVTPFDMQSISFSDNSASTNSDNVKNAIENFYDEVGVSQQLFNADTSSALKMSLQRNESLMFYMNRKIECWINRHVSRKFKGLFEVQILDVTNRSKDELVSEYRQNATLGVPNKLMLASLSGLTPQKTAGLTFLENEVLDINNTWKPLSTSYTQSGDSEDEGGRPTSDTLDESGEQTRESDANSNRTEV